MKKLFLTVVTAATTLGATIPLANAAATNSNFIVSANLTAACTLGTFSTTGIAFDTVTAFTAPANKTTEATLKCTRGFAPTSMTIEAAIVSGGGSGASGGANATTPTGAGVLANGLYYTLSASLTAVQSGTAPTAASGLNTTRDADERVLTVTGAMPAQAGGTTTGAASHTRTMTITF